MLYLTLLETDNERASHCWSRSNSLSDLKYCSDVKVTAGPLLPQLCSNYRPLIWGVSYNTTEMPITRPSYRCVRMSSPGPTLQSARGGHKTNQGMDPGIQKPLPTRIFVKYKLEKALSFLHFPCAPNTSALFFFFLSPSKSCTSRSLGQFLTWLV